eukprot:scaffold272694_cov15-Tisochrysis_lutea.AAC.2
MAPASLLGLNGPAASVSREPWGLASSASMDPWDTDTRSRAAEQSGGICIWGLASSASFPPWDADACSRAASESIPRPDPLVWKGVAV